MDDHNIAPTDAGVKGPSVEVSEGPYPTVVTRPDRKPCLVLQSYFAGKYLGHIQVEFDSDGDVLHWSGLPILLNSSIPEGMATFSLTCKWIAQPPQ